MLAHDLYCCPTSNIKNVFKSLYLAQHCSISEEGERAREKALAYISGASIFGEAEEEEGQTRKMVNFFAFSFLSFFWGRGRGEREMDWRRRGGRSNSNRHRLPDPRLFLPLSAPGER